MVKALMVAVVVQLEQGVALEWGVARLWLAQWTVPDCWAGRC